MNARGNIQLLQSPNNTIKSNTLPIGGQGIKVEDHSNNNIVANNNISNNDNGIFVTSSYDNKIYHNNIINNADQGYDTTINGNQWDNGYPFGGNYWSDYVGLDNFKGPHQNITGSDGIGDTNYSIDMDSIDYYPLMEPYSYKPFENYTILKQGWNLISIPLIQEKQNSMKCS